MALTPGPRLGPYEIIATIGAGGMGEVYRAATRVSPVTSRSKSLPKRSPPIRTVASASSGRRRPSLPFPIRNGHVRLHGARAGARADVFAFGAVLYEMLSGRRAFQRATAADTMTAILTQDPPEIVGSRPDLSPALDRIVRHCLEKNPNERFVLTGTQLIGQRIFTGTLTRMTLDGGQRPVLENVTEADWAPDGESFAVIRRVTGQSQLE